MLLPPDSARARLLWSIPAALIIALWTVGVLGAAVTRFPDSYTFPQVLGRIAHGGCDMFWPGEFGRYSNEFFAAVQAGPLLAVLLWLICLVPWRSRVWRVVALVVALLIPAGYLFFAPWLIVTELASAWPLIFGIGYGEEWQDGNVLVTAMALWWWLLLPLIVFTARRHVSQPSDNRCPACGYSTIGLRGSVCPECGGAVRRT